MASESTAARVDIVDDDYQEFDHTSTKKRLTSKVWEEMEKINSEKARCKHCKKILQAGLNIVDDIVSKIHDGVKNIKKSVARKHRFYDFAEKSFHLNTTRRLMLDMCVRWNSIYLMLEHAIYYKQVLQHWGQRDIFFKMFMLSEEEWGKVDKLHKFLKVFYDVICMFSTTKYHTSNNYFKGVWMIHRHLMLVSKESQNFMTDMVRNMKEKFDKYWDEYSMILSCAAVLDPRCKIRLVEYCFDKLYGNEAEEHVNAIIKTLHDLFDEYKENFSYTSFIGSCSQFDMSERNGDGDGLEEYEQFLNSKRKIQSEKTLLDIYLEKQNLDIKADVDVLEYWSKSSLRYLELASMARDILVIPISTVASESTFSIGKKVINLWRSSLKFKTIQALIFQLYAMGSSLLGASSKLSLLEEDEGSNSSDDDDENVELDDMF
uniref:Zinc finger BED domain-containing protein DAYSLEEPER-like n=1 Tax=Nelumbo nucifera TaxID=4432 RepID=A0A1U8ASB8_NELNU